MFGGVIISEQRITNEVRQGMTVLAKAVSTKDQIEQGANNALSQYNLSAIKENLYAKNATTIGTNGETLKYDPVSLAAELLSSEVYTKYWWGNIVTDGRFWTLKESGSEVEVAELFFDMTRLVGEIDVKEQGSAQQKMLAIDFYRAAVAVWDGIPMSERIESDEVNTNDESTKNDKANYDAELHALYKVYVYAYDKCVLKQASETNIITNLASYFKDAAWSMEEGAWQPNKSVIQNALMYAILVVQSLIFFIAYTKRLFYVVMLILMAPIVVVFDFFTKFGK